jgi:hypothetical protein
VKSVVKAVAEGVLAAVGGLTAVLAVDAALLRGRSARTVCRQLIADGVAVPVADAEPRAARVAVFVPGVVARALPNVTPLLQTLTPLGDVQLVDYEGERFDAGEAVQALAGLIAQDLRRYERVVIWGESMGGMLAAHALDVLRLPMEQRARLTVVLSDSPAGESNIVLPISRITDWFYPGPLLQGFGNGLFGLVHLAGKAFGYYPGPVHWSWSAVHTPTKYIDPVLDAREVQVAQQEACAGFKLALFADQTRFIRGGLPPLDALVGVRVVYLMNWPELDIPVRQPLGRDEWVAAAARAGAQIESIDVAFPSRHCDYYGWRHHWNALAAEILQ